MTARSWQVVEENGEIADCEMIEEGQPSSDAQTNAAPDPRIAVAQAGIKMLLRHIIEIQDGQNPTWTVQEIGQALVGTPAPHPNWFEKVCLAKCQEKLLKAAARSIWSAMDTLDNDLYATRVKACHSILEDAYEELKGEGHGFEGDES